MRLLLALLFFTLGGQALQAGPLDKLIESAGQGGTLARLPDDNVEGTVWEYKAKFEGRVKEGEKKPEPLEGRFRTKGEAVFDVGRKLQMPDLPRSPRAAAEALRRGPPSEIKLPTTQVKRIGEYRRSKSKLIIQFDDEKGLHGTMTLRRKKRTSTVWHGDYREKEGKKTVRKWSVEVRPIED